MPSHFRSELAEISARAPMNWRVASESRSKAAALEASPLTVDQPRAEWTNLSSQIEFDSSAPMAAYRLQSAASRLSIICNSLIGFAFALAVWRTSHCLTC